MTERHPLKYQTPNAAQTTLLEGFQAKARELYDMIKALPTSREQSLALTKLEETVMWGNKCISFRTE